jgi:hypothetical protein
MAIRRPGPDDLRSIAHQLHFSVPDEQMPAFQVLLEGFLAPYERLDQLEAPKQQPRYARDGGAAPAPKENPLGAWAWRVRIQGAADGPLAGRTVAIKDNVAVAGVPMRNGTALLDGYLPDEDATVVERVLDAGATILGKSVCESLCFSGGSHTADSGPVRNPYDPTRSTGGSSSGSAALVAAGEVDMAIGGDRADRCASRAAGRESTGSNRRGVWCPTPARSRPRLPLIISARWRAAAVTSRCCCRRAADSFEREIFQPPARPRPPSSWKLNSSGAHRNIADSGSMTHRGRSPGVRRVRRASTPTTDGQQNV